MTWFTFVTAIWNVYSVIALADLLENLAKISMMESPVFRRETSKVMPTSLSETVRVVEDGRLSSGNAEVKFQSSSAGVPFVVWFVAMDGAWGFDAAKSKSEVGLAWLCCVPCWGALDEKAAKGSEGCEGGGWRCCLIGGAGVDDCEVGRELFNAANTS